MIEPAKRLKTVKEYYFSTKLREVRAMIASGKPVINMAIGSPDLKPPQQVIKAFQESLNDVNAHKYQSYQGLPEFRSAIANFYEKQFSVKLNATNEVLPLMGSKEGIMHISLAFLNAGDEVLIPNPGYPTYTSVTKLVEAKPVFYNLNEENNWQPNLEELEKLDLTKVKIMWVNYPHMPTGAAASLEALQKIVNFGLKHKILIVNDNPYSFILNENPLSILQVKKAKEIALELNSFSKTFNMAGWRIGMLLGNNTYIKEVLNVKSNMDSGMFYGIQKGAIEALQVSDSWLKEQNNIYLERRKLVYQFLDKLGFTYSKNATGLFVWAKIPDGKIAEDVTETLLKNYNIFIAPGTIFGPAGKGYVRVSLCVDASTIHKAIKRL